MQSLAFYGGTFDPVHIGHIETALCIQNFFHFDRFFFLPCKNPLLKPPTLASAEQRVQMLTLALKNHPEFHLDLREVQRDTPSYMVESLESIRKEYPKASITLILGRDALANLPSWYQSNKLLTLSNFLVIERQNVHPVLPLSVQTLLKEHQTSSLLSLKNHLYGKIAHFDAGYFPFASREIRRQIQAGSPVSQGLDCTVYAYIKAHKLYGSSSK